jgi:hypothetical protein
MLVEQLVQMKLGVGLYFEPLPQLKPSTPSWCVIRMINVQTCPTCGEEFYFYDICIARAVTHIIHGVWWIHHVLKKNARWSFVKKCFKRIGAFHLDYQILWLSVWFIEGGGYQRC